MGYTHYWVSFATPPKGVAEELRPLIAHGEKAGVLFGAMGVGPPDSEFVRFNGDASNGDALETFDVLEMGVYPRETGGFCKTCRKPYDSYVMAAIYRLIAKASEIFRFSTDGSYQEWEEGSTKENLNPRELYKEVYGEEPPPVRGNIKSLLKDPEIRRK